MRELFGPRIEPKDYAEHVLYDENTLQHLLILVPAKDMKTLTITWPQLPDRRHLWDGKPANYISHCIGHEGKYSLKSELIKQGLVVTCDAGCGARLNSCVSNLSVTCNLTDRGVEKWEEVVRLTFAFINKMRKSGVKTYIMHELKTMNRIGFDFTGRKPALATSSSLALALSAWRGTEK